MNTIIEEFTTLGQVSGPHAGVPVFQLGAPLEAAKGICILMHGRGADARDILSLVPEIYQPDLAYLAPQANGFQWYPNRFNVPLKDNEPWLSSALDVVRVLLDITAGYGILSSQTVLLGFSQGACLALEYSARNPQRYGAVIGLSGALIGPPGLNRQPSGLLAKTPVFLGCSDTDPHIPLQLVNDSAVLLSKMDAQVEKRIYPNMGHTINTDEITVVRQFTQRLILKDGVNE